MNPVLAETAVAPMDYRATLKHAMAYVSANSSMWFNPSNQEACATVARRLEQGPISAKEMAYISTLMPLSYLLQLRPIVADTGTFTTSTNIDGLQTWYWGFSTLNSESGTLNTDSAVFLAVKRITANSMQTKNVSTWVVTAGAVNPATRAWVTQGPIFLDDHHVQRIRTGISFANKHVSGSINTSLNGKLFNFSVNFMDAGFEFSVSASSKRGFLRPGQDDIASQGRLSEERAWSIVDGAISSTTVTQAAGVPDLVNNLSIRTPGKTIDGFYRYAKGCVWLDIKTLGLQQLSKLNVFLASMFSRSHMYHRRLAVKMQFAKTQIQCLVTDPTSVHSITAHRPTYCKGAVHVWHENGQSHYGLDANISVVGAFFKSNAHSAVNVSIPGFGNFALTSLATTKPLTPDFNGAYFLSPCHLTLNGKNLIGAAAVMEWVPGDLFPQEYEAVKIAGFSGIQKSWKANQSARATLALAFIAIIFIYICCFLCIVDLLPLPSLKTKNR